MKDFEKYKLAFYIAAFILLFLLTAKIISQPNQQIQIVNVGDKKIQLSYDTLRSIEGVGDKKATKIINYLKAHKTNNLYDLTKIDGVGEVTIKKLIKEGVYIVDDRPSNSK